MHYAVGMSGGVDSAVSALLLRQAGHTVTGWTMAMWDGRFTDGETLRNSCYSPAEPETLARAAELCRRIGIAHLVVDVRDAFRECVLDYVRDEYVAGRTPNPCVQCNRQVKFGAVPEALRSMIPDYDLLATGHYARIVHTDHGARLQRAADRYKDQTYFLAGLPSQVLEGVHFPLGEYSKDQIKQIAADAGFSDLISGESQDFMGGGNYTLLFEEGQVVPGDIVDTAGRVLGRHSGIAHYTVGQRRGMGIAAPEPLYVCAIDAANNRIIVGGKSEVYHAAFTARGLNMFDGLGDGERVLVRVRQQHREAPATVFIEGDDMLRFVFDEPQLAITPGQLAVVYRDDIVAAAATICEVLPDE